MFNVSSHISWLNRLRLTIYLYFTEVDWLEDTRLCCQETGVKNSPCGRDDLTPSSVDGISVKSDIIDVEPHSTKILLTQYTLCVCASP